MDKISNSHDALFKEIWKNKKEAKTLLKNCLPKNILKIIDIDSIEISKDSFVEKELKEFYSDLLYKVKFREDEGYVYLLFEHKSYTDKWIFLQLLEYMLKIWRLYINQTKTDRLPIIIPLVLYHGRTKWKIDTRFATQFSGPRDSLSDYIPDFKIILYDLTQFSDEEIRGSILTRVVLLLMKHIFDPDIVDKLPGIFMLINDLLKQDTGLQYFETILRYLFSSIDNITENEVKEIIEKSLSDVKGDIIMTLAEKWRNEGYERGMRKGRQEGIKQGVQQGIREGLLEGIELAVTLKYGSSSDQQKLLELIKNIKDIDRLKTLKNAIMNTGSIPELIESLSK